MYCSACGSQITPSLSYCNRCGASLKERPDSPETKTIAAFLTAIIIIALAGLGLMLGGAMALRNEANFGGEIIGPFMAMVFILVLIVEVYLCRMLAKASGSRQRQPQLDLPPPQNELSGAQPRGLPEPIPSVTENTTRTLQYQESPRFK